jgi:uncharacterized protein (DUF1015 family)
MARIYPFRALRYNPSMVRVEDVVTQPYDKITPAMQQAYYQRSIYNLVRIILGLPELFDEPGSNDVYTRAARDFADWRRMGVLAQEKDACIFAYSQRFTVPGGDGEIHERRAFIALGELCDYSHQVVFRHEQTLSKPKSDRLNLLRATRSHFGQIFMLYSDPALTAEKILFSGKTAPEIEVTDEYGVTHRVWKVSDMSTINILLGAMEDKKLIIADGHHRYETALTYRDERRAAAASPPNSGRGAAPYEFVMMTFVNMNSPGLVILPTHRLVHSLPSFSEEGFRGAARSFFDIDEVSATLDASRAMAILRESGRAGTSILAVTANRAFLLHHPNPNTQQVFAGFSLRQQALDVLQLHQRLLEGVLHLSEESIRNQRNISYVRDAGEALTQVRGGGGADIAFLLNPCRMAQVRDIAFGGEVMPQKSTDFYPKLLSGLTVYALD